LARSGGRLPQMNRAALTISRTALVVVDESTARAACDGSPGAAGATLLSLLLQKPVARVVLWAERYLFARGAPAPAATKFRMKRPIRSTHRGVEYSVTLSEKSDRWTWQFSIGSAVKTGKVTAKLDLYAQRLVQKQIDRELCQRNKN
jgi:hypothetical protein